VQCVSTRRVDELVQALGLQGISKSQVSRLCQELDAEIERFRTRKLEGPYPYVWLDATFVKVRDGGRLVSLAVVVAIGVRATGEREVLGLDVGPSEDGAFWHQVLRSLVARGLGGVRLVTSDAHEGLKGAIAAVLQGAAWQRCRVHFVRNALAYVPKGAQAMVAATIHTVFVQPSAEAARAMATRRGQFSGTLRAPGAAAGRRGSRCAGVPGLPARALATGLEQQPVGATQQGGQAPDRCGGHLSDRRRGRALGRGGMDGASGKVPVAQDVGPGLGQVPRLPGD
jgi:hypothetical protein